MICNLHFTFSQFIQKQTFKTNLIVNTYVVALNMKLFILILLSIALIAALPAPISKIDIISPVAGMQTKTKSKFKVTLYILDSIAIIQINF